MVTFTYGALSITFRAPEFSDTEEVNYIQTRGRTQDGLLYVGDKGVRAIQRNLVWKVLSPAVKTQLETFFSSTYVNGSMNSFEYVDHAGVSHTVRLVNDTLIWGNYFTDLFSLSMTLEEISSTVGS